MSLWLSNAAPALESRAPPKIERAGARTGPWVGNDLEAGLPVQGHLPGERGLMLVPFASRELLAGFLRWEDEPQGADKPAGNQLRVHRVPPRVDGRVEH